MVWAAALALALAANGAAIKSDLEDTELMEWIKANSLTELDIYPDGTVWVSAGRSATGAEFGLLARDLKAMQGKRYGNVWLISNYINDKTVKIRQTKERLYINCDAKTFATGTWISYGPDMTVVAQGKGNVGYGDDVVPGSFGERWVAMACK